MGALVLPAAPVLPCFFPCRTARSSSRRVAQENHTGKAGTSRFSSHVATQRTCSVPRQNATLSPASPTQRIYLIHSSQESSRPLTRPPIPSVEPSPARALFSFLGRTTPFLPPQRPPPPPPPPPTPP